MYIIAPPAQTKVEITAIDIYIHMLSNTNVNNYHYNLLDRHKELDVK